MTTRTIDTNVLVRIFAKDDSEQWQIASNLFTSHRIVILSTVLLETEWVLRKTIGLDVATIVQIFRSMLASETVIFPEHERVSKAVDAFELGMDFADAFHIYGTESGETLVSFDRDLVKYAKRHISDVAVALAQ